MAPSRSPGLSSGSVKQDGLQRRVTGVPKAPDVPVSAFFGGATGSQRNDRVGDAVEMP